MIPSSVARSILQEAYKAEPFEACGFVLRGDRVYPVENRAENPALDFAISPEDFNQASREGAIEAVYHTHPVGTPEGFSLQDIKAAKALGIPWCLVCIPSEKTYFYDPKNIAPYVGREWIWTYQNCFALLKDYYWQELGIRFDEFWLETAQAWTDPNWNQFMENMPGQGFTALPLDIPWQKHDVIQMKIGRAKHPNHVGILIDLDKNLMLHHMTDRLSELSVFGGSWLKVSHCIWRHHSLC